MGDILFYLSCSFFKSQSRMEGECWNLNLHLRRRILITRVYNIFENDDAWRSVFSAIERLKDLLIDMCWRSSGTPDRAYMPGPIFSGPNPDHPWPDWFSSQLPTIEHLMTSNLKSFGFPFFSRPTGSAGSRIQSIRCRNLKIKPRIWISCMTLYSKTTLKINISMKNRNFWTRVNFLSLDILKSMSIELQKYSTIFGQFAILCYNTRIYYYEN